MSDKSTQKKEYIISKARSVFVEKGYSTVTMKDIVDACEISRGGLYLYFSSTSDLFLAVLKKETEESDDLFSSKITDKTTPINIFMIFLKEQKKELLRKKDSLGAAIYEYFFSTKFAKKENLLGRQFTAAVKVLEKLITACNETGDFCCENPHEAARNIMYVIEGLKIMAQTVGLSESEVDREFIYILKNLAVDEE